MQVERPDLLFTDTTVINYINQIKENYELKIKSLQSQHEQQYKTLLNEYGELKEKYELLVYKRFARSAEQLLKEQKQPLLFNEEAEQPELEKKEEEQGLQKVKPFTRKKAGRKPLSSNLQRREKIIDICENEKTCACGAKLSRIGEETSEKLQIIPPEIYVEKAVRPKYACRCCEGTDDEDRPTVRIAKVPPSIIPRSIASASVLSTIITQKFEMHLPYYRQEKQFKQIEAEISRQDMSNWQQQVYVKLRPLLVLFKDTVKSGTWMQMDDTTVQVIGEEGRDDKQ
jgi:transposase